MTQDDMFKYIGSFGRYQKWILCLQFIPWIFCSLQTSLSVFILFTPEHKCIQPGISNITLNPDQHDVYTRNIPTLNIKGVATPTEDGYIFSRCEVYREIKEDKRSLLYDDQRRSNSTVYRFECREWLYDRSEVAQTLVTKHNLVCRKKLHRTHAMMSFMGGFTVGSLLIGIISDRFGRKKALILSLFLYIIFNTAVSFVDEFVEFVALRFLSGASVAGILTTAYVLALEYVGPKKRMMAGMMMQFSWGTGTLLTAGIAYLIRDWRYLNLAVSVPPVFLLSYIWLVPESVSWLIAKNKTDAAAAIIRKIAKVNKVKIPEKVVLSDLRHEQEELSRNFHRSLKFIAHTIIICLNWMVVSMEFSGLSLYAGNLTGNLYMNFFLLSLAEFCGFLIIMPLLNRVGRKPVYITSVLIAGIALLLTIFPVLLPFNESVWIISCLFIIGKIGASAAFATIFLYTAEFFPTIVRNSSVGLCSLCARVGGMISPYIVDLGYVVDGHFGKTLPTIVFGVASLSAGILALSLRDTLERNTTEIVQDAEKRGQPSYHLAKKSEVLI